MNYISKLSIHCFLCPCFVVLTVMEKNRGGGWRRKESVSWEEKKTKLDDHDRKQGAPRYQLQIISCSKRIYKELGEMTWQATLQKVKGLANDKRECDVVFPATNGALFLIKTS